MSTAPVSIERDPAEVPAWELARRKPAMSLRGLASDYTGYIERSPTPAGRRHAPSTTATLILPFGPQLEVAAYPGAEYASFEGGFAAGLHDTFALTRWTGDSAGIQIDLTPPAARLIFGMPMSEISGRVVSLDALLGREGRELSERVRSLCSWEDRFDALDAFLAARLRAAPLPSKGLLWAWDRLILSGGLAPIADLASTLGWSHKRLIETFRDHIGLAPKTAARIARFDRLMARVAAATNPCWGDLAADCGYYDQSHLIRDFVQFTGSPPRDFLRRRVDGGGMLD